MVSNNKKVAKAVRLELDEIKNDIYIVFKIIDEQFKQRIRANWQEDTELKFENNNLVILEKED